MDGFASHFVAVISGILAGLVPIPVFLRSRFLKRDEAAEALRNGQAELLAAVWEMSGQMNARHLAMRADMMGELIAIRREVEAINADQDAAAAIRDWHAGDAGLDHPGLRSMTSDTLSVLKAIRRH